MLLKQNHFPNGSKKGSNWIGIFQLILTAGVIWVVYDCTKKKFSKKQILPFEEENKPQSIQDYFNSNYE